MAEVNQGRWTAEIEGDFVVFLIGFRPNSLWQAVKSFGDLGGRRGMSHMLQSRPPRSRPPGAPAPPTDESDR